MLPLKLKWVLRREFWPQFQNLLKQGTEVWSTRRRYGAISHSLWGLSALGAVLMALLMQQSFTVHRYTKGTLMTPATQTMPGLRLLLSAYTLTVRTMCR